MVMSKFCYLKTWLLPASTQEHAVT